MKKLYFLLFVLFIALDSFGQTTVFQESFESTATYITSMPEQTDGSYDYFTVTDGSTIAPVYNLPDGTYFFAAQDLDADGMTEPAQMFFDDIDISTFSDLTFAILMAEADASDGNEDWDNGDYLHIEYDIDNSGSYTNLIWVSNDGTTFNAAPLIDTNFDGLGDGSEVNSTFSEFSAAIAGTGNLIDIKITFGGLTSSDEDIAIDNIRIIDGYVSCAVGLGTESYSCNASTTGLDGVTISIPYTGSDASITSVTSSSGTIGGDNPASVSDGVITITGYSEGDTWDLTLIGGACDGTSASGTVPSVECLPTACYDLTGGSYEFDIIQITANDDLDNWSLSGGEYYINGYCSGCTNATTDSWLIFGSIDMSSSSGTELVFNAEEGFSGSDLIISYTEAYSGAPDTTSWTNIQTITSGSEGYYNISIPSTGSSVYIGVQYADGDGTYSSWALTNVGVYATSCPTLGVSNIDMSTFKIYPNPTSTGSVSIMSSNSAPIQVKVYDILGKQVRNETINSTLNVSGLKSGIYILNITQEGHSVTKKLVID